MKLTRDRLKQIIKEELSELSELSEESTHPMDKARSLVVSLDAQLKGRTWETLPMNVKVNLIANALSSVELEKYTPGEPVQEAKKR